MRLSPAIVAAALAAPAAAQEPFEGWWATDPAYCRWQEPGYDGPAPYHITADRLVASGADCTITDLRRGLDDATWWEMRMTCPLDGVDRTWPVLFVLTDDDDVLWWHEGRFPAIPYDRCPA